MGRQIVQPHPVYGWSYIPDLRARVVLPDASYLVRTNSAGFRSDRQFEPSRRDGRFRVLLFGDSFTAADGVSNRDRYSDVLERLDPGLEILNFGLTGSGTDQQLLIYRDAAQRYEHDLVAVAVLVENTQRITSRYRVYRSRLNGERLIMRGPWFELDRSGVLGLHGVPVPAASLRRQDLPRRERRHLAYSSVRHRVLARLPEHVVDTFYRVTRFPELPEYNSRRSAPWLLMSAILSAWATESRVPLLVVPLPMWRYIEGPSSARAYQRRFRELAAAQPNITLHDPLDDLRGRTERARRELRFEHDYHPTPAMHQALAESLAGRLTKFRSEVRRPPPPDDAQAPI